MDTQSEIISCKNWTDFFFFVEAMCLCKTNPLRLELENCLPNLAKSIDGHTVRIYSMHGKFYVATMLCRTLGSRAARTASDEYTFTSLRHSVHRWIEKSSWQQSVICPPMETTACPPMDYPTAPPLPPCIHMMGTG